MSWRTKLALASIGLLLVVGSWYVWRALNPSAATRNTSSLIGDTVALPELGFAKADSSHTWDFPADYAPHPAYQQERWLFRTVDDCAVGLTAEFRLVNILPTNFPLERTSAWAVSSVMTGEFEIVPTAGDALTAVVDSRVALDLAGADADRVWVEGWRLDWTAGTFTLQSVTANLSFNFSLADPQPQANDGTWYRYERAGEGTGTFTYNDTTQELACAVVLTHQFGTP